MPCNSDYLNPNEREEAIQEAAKLTLYVCKELNRTPPVNIVKQAKDHYANDDTVIPFLCGVLSSMKKKDVDRIVYNAKNKTSRRLADWWEEHQEADRERIRQEKQDKEDKARNKILQKLENMSLKDLQRLVDKDK